MSDLAHYVYGLVPPGQIVPTATGIEAGAVRALPMGDLAALISDVPPGPVTRTRRNMLAHTKVLEAALAFGTVLPLRFGTIAPHLTALADCINANRSAFHAALDGVQGRVELGLRASWHKGLVYNEIIDRDPELRRLRDRLRSRSATETYYERIELGRRVEAALAALRVTEAAMLTAELADLRDREADVTAAEDDMIFNRAFLVRRDAEAAFDAAVSRIAERHAARVALRYVGPVPPFNFVTMQAGWMTAGMGAG